ncbi:BTAD domain-containing putative transcriptional regulator [Catellatospora citrea]|uniref:AfsR/SARP family transcriptional regulator n=1 Tax=Catellatospora citrea TaxID=53366 RepID=UPI0033E54640
MSVYVGVLGPVAVESGTSDLPLAGRQIRTVLAVLALRRPEFVAVEQLVAALWPQEPPRTAITKVHGHVSCLRRALGCHDARHPHPHCAIATGHQGYRLDTVDTDLSRFRLLLNAAREGSGGDPAQRAEHLRTALALWRGRPCADLTEVEVVRVHAAGITESYLDTLEDYASVSVELGRPRDVVGLLRKHWAAYPHRERLLGHLMAALALSGRVGEALAAYRDGRRLLLDELGVEPGSELRQLHMDLLRGQLRPFDRPGASLVA